MDLLRRIFGLQPTTPPSPLRQSAEADLDGPTAPLNEQQAAAVATSNTAAPATDSTTTTQPDADGGQTRKLPDFDEIIASTGKNGQRITFGQHSDVGQVRSNNQDAILSQITSSTSADEQPEFGIFVVADGMGGHHDGEKASALTARVVAHYVANTIFLPILSQVEPDSEQPTIAEVLRDAVQYANERVSKEVPEGGTTATVATIIGDLAYIGHVGDSRAYLIASDEIEQLTRDHSLVQRLIELEQLTPEEAAEHPQRNVLYRAIGQSEMIDVDAVTRRLTSGSRLLICSDGLWNLVPEDEIKSIVLSSPTPQSACETLVKLANERGGPDNISVILIKTPD